MKTNELITQLSKRVSDLQDAFTKLSLLQDAVIESENSDKTNNEILSDLRIKAWLLKYYIDELDLEKEPLTFTVTI
ncbi:MAG: hypothetical protein IIB56_18425 [Planctomycetes bacterium]|nr:hypothetical protein [Planctomycetota bacterium]